MEAKTTGQDESTQPAESAPVEARPPLPAVTLLLCIACAVVFVGITAQGSNPSWDALAKWGYPPGDRVWEGAYWALLTSAFVHLELWHVAFNVYWLWTLGGPVERVLGPGKWLAFVAMAAFVSSSAQLAASGGTGHGASGVVYAAFGLLWASRGRAPALAAALDPRIVRLFWYWLVGCIVVTQLGVFQVGNAAHVGGLLLGILTGRWLFPGRRRGIALAGTVLLVAASVVPLFWCPWSPSWLGFKAYRAHMAGHYDAAIAAYRKAIKLGGNRTWALGNLASAYHSKGAESEYAATLAELRTIDAAAAAEVERVNRRSEPGHGR